MSGLEDHSDSDVYSDSPSSSGSWDRLGESGLDTSIDLILLASAGDGAAWNKLNKLYSPLINYWCLQRQIPRQEWSNIRQEVFSRLWIAFDGKKYVPRRYRGSFRSYLRTTTRNYIISEYFRSRAHRIKGISGVDQLPDVSVVDGEPSEQELSRELRILYLNVMKRIRRRFKPREVDIFMAYVVYRRKAKDVAADFKVSLNQVYKIRARVLGYVNQEFGIGME